MLSRIRQAILGLNVIGERREQADLVRKAAVLVARFVRLPGAKMTEAMEGLAATAQAAEDETSSWVSADAIHAGEAGPFDALDLRVWLALSERAGVPFVPAKTILVLSQEEAELGSGAVEIPDNAVTRGARKRIAALAIENGAEAEPAMTPEARAEKLEALEDRLFSAMDDVPEGWMVRYARCGSSELKALAGSGLAGPEAPETRFGPDLEIGPGWVRVGNRRRVQISDQRTVTTMAQGPDGEHAFLARPWIEAARYAAGPDPHRHGTPFAGKGLWPAEWRAFVEKGGVVGVASYYGWCGSATHENARIAIEVRNLAQRIVDEAVKIRAVPRFLDLEILRRGASEEVRTRPGIAEALALFPVDDVACTLDFIEARDGGLMLLEGGPANTPVGGGHPCAFAGCGGPPTFGAKTLTEGVAFRLMPGVILADPKSWIEGDRTDAILTWTETLALARKRPEMDAGLAESDDVIAGAADA